MSLNIAPGEKVALCGPSGSGKTTLIMALLRMVELSEGKIMMDDIDISMVQGDEVRSRLNVVPQEPFGSTSIPISAQATSPLRKQSVSLVCGREL
jgi:ATP-binding cassette subfamily C (CFTR/MRP) protein 1